MTILDDTLPAQVIDVLAIYGKDADFVVPGASVYDIDTGGGRTLSKVTFTHKITPPFPYEAKLWDGDTIRRDDLKTFVEATGLSFTPDTSTKVRFDGREFGVVAVEPVFSGENVILFELHLRA